MSETIGFTQTDNVELKGKDHEVLATFKEWFDASKSYMRPLHWQWYKNENAYHGVMNILYNKQSQQVIFQPIRPNKDKIVINKIYSNLRSIRNFVTADRPQWKVLANSTDENVVNNAEKSGDYLDYQYDNLNMPFKIKASVLHALKYGGSILQYGWDEEAVGIENQKGECDVWVVDPFDFYPDPAGANTGDIQNCRFIDKVVSVPIQNLVNNPNYRKIDITKIPTDGKQSAAEFKNNLLKAKFGTSITESGGLGTVLLHELYYKIQEKTKSEDGEMETEDVIYVASWVEGFLLRNEKTTLEKYPYEFYASDVNPGELYGDGFIKHDIPIAKARNRLESQILEYNNTVNLGRYIVREGSGVDKITDTIGERIVVDDINTAIREVAHSPLSPDSPAQIQRLDRYEEDIIGVKEAFLGGTGGATSGTAIESLKAQTASNLRDLKDNLEFALAKVGEGILDMAAQNYIAPRMIKGMIKGNDATDKSFSVIGQAGVEPGGQIGEDTTVIGRMNQVKVSISSGLAYTFEGRMNRIKELIQLKIIDPQTALKHMEFADIENIIKGVDLQNFKDMVMQNGGIPPAPGQPPQGAPGQMPQGQPPMQPQGAPQGQPEQEQPDPEAISAEWVSLAQEENDAMAQGNDIPPTEGATPEHTHEHVRFSGEPQVQNDDKLLRRLAKHINGEELAQGAPPQEGEVQ